MFSKILVPLDGSGTAEKVLPFVRCFARGLQIPVELARGRGYRRNGSPHRRRSSRNGP